MGKRAPAGALCFFDLFSIARQGDYVGFQQQRVEGAGMYTQPVQMFNATTATGNSPVFELRNATRNYQMIVSGTGNVSATATVYGSTTRSGPWVPMITFNAAGNGQASDSGETYRMWRYAYAELSSIQGVGAAVDLNVEG